MLRLRRKTANISLLSEVENEEAYIDLSLSQEVLTSLKLLHLTKRDLQIARVISPLIAQHISEIVTYFYDHIMKNELARSIIERYSSVEKLSQTLSRHVKEIFSGTIDQCYMLKREKIAHIHVKINLPQELYIGSFQTLYDAIIQVIQRQVTNEDDVKEIMQVVSKLLYLEQTLVSKAYDEELSRLKENELQAEREKMNSLKNTLDELKHVEKMAEQFRQTTEQKVVEATASITDGMQTADYTFSILDRGVARLQRVEETIKQVTTATEKIVANIIDLEKLSLEIKDISEIVKNIAGQTNLLALNASIEAARAGEHGAGFSVVANEVKELAEQATKSAEQITDLIIQTIEQISDGTKSTEQMQNELGKTKEQMEETTAMFANINEATDESQRSFQTIEKNVQELDDILQNVQKFIEVIEKTTNEIEQMLPSDIEV